MRFNISFCAILMTALSVMGAGVQIRHQMGTTSLSLNRRKTWFGLFVPLRFTGLYLSVMAPHQFMKWRRR